MNAISREIYFSENLSIESFDVSFRRCWIFLVPAEAKNKMQQQQQQKMHSVNIMKVHREKTCNDITAKLLKKMPFFCVHTILFVE